MNRKGFTLVELLAVIIILALLAVIASTSVTKVVDDSKNDLQTAQIKLIEDAAKTWGAENMSSLPEGNNCIYLTLKDLKTYGLIDSDIRNPKTEKKLSNDLKIKITSKTSNYNTEVLNYEVDPESVEGCKEFYKSICTLIEGEPKEIGSKYQCKVKDDMEKGFEDGYYFYVLSEGENGTTNLILDRNVYYDETTGERGLTDSEHDGLVAWNESGSNENGPVTAMDYLEKATASWTNLEKMTINEFDFYDDEGNFVKKETMKTYNVYARLPHKIEVNAVGCEDYSELTCPLWMVEYLYDAEEDYGEDYQQKPLNNISGYWTSSAYSDDSYIAWSVYYYGYVTNDFVDYDDTGCGVRPVINLKL